LWDVRRFKRKGKSKSIIPSISVLNGREGFVSFLLRIERKGPGSGKEELGGGCFPLLLRREKESFSFCEGMDRKAEEEKGWRKGVQTLLPPEKKERRRKDPLLLSPDPGEEAQGGKEGNTLTFSCAFQEKGEGRDLF